MAKTHVMFSRTVPVGREKVVGRIRPIESPDDPPPDGEIRIAVAEVNLRPDEVTRIEGSLLALAEACLAVGVQMVEHARCVP